MSQAEAAVRERRLRSLALAVATMTAGFGLLSVWWRPELDRARLPLDYWGWLTPATAASLLLAAAALALLAWERRRRAGRTGGAGRWARAMAAAGMGWSGVVLVARLWQTPGPMSERISPTMVAMLALCAAMALPARRHAQASGLALAVAVVGLVGALEHMFAAPWSPLGPHTRALNPAMAFAMVLLALGWLGLEPERRPTRLLFEYSSTGWLMRRVIPALLVFPILLAWTRAEQARAHTLGAWVSSMALVMLSFLVFITLLWKAATALDRLDRSRGDLQSFAREIADLYHNAPCGYVSLDGSGRIANINDTALGWLGYRREEVLGRLNVVDLMSAEGAAAFEGHLPALQTAGAAPEIEVELRRKDGSWLTALVSSTAFRDLERGVLRTRTTFVDITERRSLERQMRQAQKMEAIGRLAAGIAHDFNNLLTVINGYSEMLLEGARGSGEADMIGNIRKAGERAALLTQQLLAFSRQQVLEPQVLDLNASLTALEPLLRRTLGEDVEFSAAFGADLEMVMADPGQIDQVLMNLVVNARDALAEHGGAICVATENVEIEADKGKRNGDLEPGRYVRMSVRDNGTGIKPEVQAHIFDPFFTTKPVGQGTGLGLSTVFGIVNQSGGAIVVDSIWGRGTTVSVYLPSGAQPARPTQPAKPERLAKAAGAARGETILVVEDEEGPRGLVMSVLRQRGYHVLEADHPVKALDLCERYAGDIQLLVTDIVMPVMTGRQLAATLVRQRPDLRVLLMSGYAERAESNLPYLQKPFAPTLLAETVRSLLD